MHGTQAQPVRLIASKVQSICAWLQMDGYPKEKQAVSMMCVGVIIMHAHAIGRNKPSVVADQKVV